MNSSWPTLLALYLASSVSMLALVRWIHAAWQAAYDSTRAPAELVRWWPVYAAYVYGPGRPRSQPEKHDRASAMFYALFPLLNTALLAYAALAVACIAGKRALGRINDRVCSSS
jgi:hypothetical protein